jgi:chromosome segregation ATPase
MNELNELEKGITDMKKSSTDQKRLIENLKAEKSGLIENSRLLNQRLTESQAAFEKTSRKIVDFIKDHINEIKLELGSLEVKTERIPGIESELSKQETFLNKLSSSDTANIERLSTELASLQKESRSQKDILDNLKINLFDNLQKSIASLKKDLEAGRREDVENSLREFKAEINRISTLEQTLESSRRYIDKKLDVLQKEISDIDSAPSQIRDINKKLSDTRKEMYLLRQESRSRDSEEEKYLAELNKSTEFMKASLSKEEEKSNELFKRVGTLESTPPIVSSLKQSLSELQRLHKDLRESKVSQQEFTKTTQSLSKNLSDIQSAQSSLDKSLSETKTSLQSQINDLFSYEKTNKTIQKDVQKKLDQRIQETNQELKIEFDNLLSITTNIQEPLQVH